MTSSRSAITCALLFAGIAAGADVAYRKSKVVDAKGKQANADTIFSDTKKSMVVSVAGHTVADVPYGAINKVSYDFSKHRRVKQGAVVMVASLGAGAIVMLTKSKSHWLTVNYQTDNVPKELVLRMDKKEYKNILNTLKAQTGKDIEFLADAGLKK